MAAQGSRVALCCGRAGASFLYPGSLPPLPQEDGTETLVALEAPSEEQKKLSRATSMGGDESMRSTLPSRTTTSNNTTCTGSFSGGLRWPPTRPLLLLLLLLQQWAMTNCREGARILICQDPPQRNARPRPEGGYRPVSDPRHRAPPHNYREACETHPSHYYLKNQQHFARSHAHQEQPMSGRATRQRHRDAHAASTLQHTYISCFFSPACPARGLQSQAHLRRPAADEQNATPPPPRTKCSNSRQNASDRLVLQP